MPSVDLALALAATTISICINQICQVTADVLYRRHGEVRGQGSGFELLYNSFFLFIKYHQEWSCGFQYWLVKIRQRVNTWLRYYRHSLYVWQRTSSLGWPVNHQADLSITRLSWRLTLDPLEGSSGVFFPFFSTVWRLRQLLSCSLSPLTSWCQTSTTNTVVVESNVWFLSVNQFKDSSHHHHQPS